MLCVRTYSTLLKVSFGNSSVHASLRRRSAQQFQFLLELVLLHLLHCAYFIYSRVLPTIIKMDRHLRDPFQTSHRWRIILLLLLVLLFYFIPLSISLFLFLLSSWASKSRNSSNTQLWWRHIVKKLQRFCLLPLILALMASSRWENIILYLCCCRCCCSSSMIRA